MGFGGSQIDGTWNLKSTQPRSMTTCLTLVDFTFHDCRIIYHSYRKSFSLTHSSNEIEQALLNRSFVKTICGTIAWLARLIAFHHCFDLFFPQSLTLTLGSSFIISTTWGIIQYTSCQKKSIRKNMKNKTSLKISRPYGEEKFSSITVKTFSIQKD